MLDWYDVPPTPPSLPAAHSGRYLVVKGSIGSASTGEVLQTALDTIPPEMKIVSINHIANVDCWYITVERIAEAK